MEKQNDSFVLVFCRLVWTWEPLYPIVGDPIQVSAKGILMCRLNDGEAFLTPNQLRGIMSC